MTLTGEDTGAKYGYGDVKNVLWIGAQADLAALAARVPAGCAADGRGGGGWRIAGGGLWIDDADDVTDDDLGPLRDLVGIDGASSPSGRSLNIRGNALCRRALFPG